MAASSLSAAVCPAAAVPADASIAPSLTLADASTPTSSRARIDSEYQYSYTRNIRPFDEATSENSTD